VPKVIWRKVASKSCHSSWLQLYSSAASAGQAHLPTCQTMHNSHGRQLLAVIQSLQQTGTWTPHKFMLLSVYEPHLLWGSVGRPTQDGRLPLRKSHLNWFSLFAQLMCVSNTYRQTHRQTHMETKPHATRSSRLRLHTVWQWCSLKIAQYRQCLCN